MTRREALASTFWGVALALAGCAAVDAPIARWSPDSGGRDELVAAMRNEMCLPRASDLEVPVPADTDIAWLEWPKKKPDCDLSIREMKGEVLLILVTKAPPQEVVDWYRSRLPHFQKAAHLGGVFLARREDLRFASEREKAHGPTLWLGPPGELWAKRGYRTSIDIQYRLR